MTATAARRTGVGLLLLLTLNLAGCSGSRDAVSDQITAVSTPTAAGTTDGQAPAGVVVSGSPQPISSTATAGMVHGFPTAVVPPPPHSTVTASALEDHGQFLAVSITGSTDLSAAAVVAFYRTALAASSYSLGTGPSTSAGVTEATFGRDGTTDVLVLAVTDRADRRSFSIGGTISVQMPAPAVGQSPGSPTASATRTS